MKMNSTQHVIICELQAELAKKDKLILDMLVALDKLGVSRWARIDAQVMYLGFFKRYGRIATNARCQARRENL
jgi:hypothetical protein